MEEFLIPLKFTQTWSRSVYFFKKSGVEHVTKTRLRSLVQICYFVSIVAMLCVLPAREAMITRVSLASTQDLPLFTVQKELNATTVEIGDFCLVTITITNLSNETAYNIHARDIIFPEWAFAIKGSPIHEWDFLEPLSNVSYAYILSPKKHGTFQLQRVNVSYSSQDNAATRSAFSNEITLVVPPLTDPVPVRDVEGLQTILFTEVIILILLIVAIISYRKTPSTQSK